MTSAENLSFLDDASLVHSSFVDMSLASSSEESFFSSLKNLIAFINRHVDLENYTVVIARFKCSKKNIKNKTVLRCDREDKSLDFLSRKRRHSNTRLIQCSFSIVTKLNDLSEWIFVVRDSNHTHDSTLAASHSTLRKMTFIDEVKDQISRQSKVQIALVKILFTLRLNANEENLIYKTRDIYNVKTKIQRDTLDNLFSVQTLMKQLKRNDWKFNYQQDDKEKLTHFFFSKDDLFLSQIVFQCLELSFNVLNCLANSSSLKDSFQKTLQFNHEALIMNCIYKTNRYRMFLFVITDQTKLNIIFYVAFVFMIKKHLSNYEWILQQLKTLYVKLSLSFLTIFVIDCEKALINAIRLKYSEVDHVFCIWHINNNVLSHCKRKFEIKEAWEIFFNEWKAMMYVLTQQKYIDAWDLISEKYNLSHSECIEYLLNIYITHYRRRFVRCFINQILHFDIIVTSRDEREHAVLKRSLMTSTDDLKIVIDDLNLLLINQRHDYVQKFEKTKMRYSMNCRFDIFRNLFSFVISKALRMIVKEYKRLIDQLIVLSACIKTFKTSLDLSCAHVIQQRLFESSECLLLEDVHSHWRFEKRIHETVNIDSLLHVQNSDVVRFRERSIEAKNRIRKEEAFDNFILRMSSQFEFVQEKMIESMNENLNEDVARMLARVDSTSRRRGRSRESERARDKDDREVRENRESRKDREDREEIREKRKSQESQEEDQESTKNDNQD